MDILINVVLPLSLAIIMLSLGVGLSFADFARVASRPKAFAIGAVSQVVFLPIVAFVVVLLFSLPPEIAVGFMLLSFCPGGVTSNMITKLSKGDVALSVSLTAVISLLSIVTVPFLAAWAVVYFMGDAAPDVSVTALAFAMFLITTLPVLIGVLTRHFATGFADRIEPVLSRAATILFLVIVVAAVASNWDIFVENLASLGPALVSMNVVLMLVGLLLAMSMGLQWGEIKTISIETGVQNAALGITLGTIITGQADGFTAMELPPAVYGITMYLVALPFVLWFRSK